MLPSQRIISSRQSPRMSACRLGVPLVVLHDWALSYLLKLISVELLESVSLRFSMIGADVALSLSYLPSKSSS